MRSMTLTLRDKVFYQSNFDPRTGNLIRQVADPRDLDYQDRHALQQRFPRRWHGIASPSPELVDISITNKCGFGCKYCYQDSKPSARHAPRELVPTILQGFKTVPYQIALGGGEPTSHPHFPWILQQARELGTVPNYTTAGHIFKPKTIRATNDYCGGVALTYHSFKGIDWFKSTYRRWREALSCQLNVHLIANKDVVQNLRDLLTFQEQLDHAIRLVLLAYYPDVGRASLSWHMTRRTYHQDLPSVLQLANSKGMMISFSEGMLPYFLSRPEIGINTRYATASEGLYSCYIGPDGRMSLSSFDPAWENELTVYATSSQDLWNDLSVYQNSPSGEACFDCKLSSQCAVPSEFHYMTCAFALHNQLPLSAYSGQRTSKYDHILGEDD